MGKCKYLNMIKNIGGVMNGGDNMPYCENCAYKDLTKSQGIKIWCPIHEEFMCMEDNGCDEGVNISENERKTEEKYFKEIKEEMKELIEENKPISVSKILHYNEMCKLKEFRKISDKRKKWVL